MTTKTIKPLEVREGQKVTAITYRGKSRFLRRTNTEKYLIRSDNGQWPTVLGTKFKPHSYAGEPVVYMTVSGDPELSYVLGLDDEVTVEVAS